MGWFKIAGKAIEYAGKIAQAEGFEEWLEEQGRAAVDSMVQSMGFRLFGKRRAAKKELLKQLKLAASSDALSAAINAEAADYTELPGRLADRFKGLPESEGYPSVIVVPRFLLNIVALANAKSRLSDSDELTRLHRHDVMKEYFFKQLVTELDKTLADAPISAKRPFPSEDDWYIVGFDRGYVWEKANPGNYYLYKKRSYEKRPDRNDVEPALDKLSVWLGRLSKDEKQEILSRLQTGA